MLAARTSVLILPSWCRLECSFTGGARTISDSVHNLIKQFGVVGFVLLCFLLAPQFSVLYGSVSVLFRFPSQRRLGMRSSNQIFIVIKFHFVIIYQSERDHLASAWIFDCMCNVNIRIWVNYWRLYVCVCVSVWLAHNWLLSRHMKFY